MNTRSIVALVVFAAAAASLAWHFSAGILLLTAAGLMAVALQDYAPRSAALTLPRADALTRQARRSERLRLAA